MAFGVFRAGAGLVPCCCVLESVYFEFPKVLSDLLLVADSLLSALRPYPFAWDLLLELNFTILLLVKEVFTL